MISNLKDEPKQEAEHSRVVASDQRPSQVNDQSQRAQRNLTGLGETLVTILAHLSRTTAVTVGPSLLPPFHPSSSLTHTLQRDGIPRVRHRLHLSRCTAGYSRTYSYGLYYATYEIPQGEFSSFVLCGVSDWFHRHLASLTTSCPKGSSFARSDTNLILKNIVLSFLGLDMIVLLRFMRSFSTSPCSHLFNMADVVWVVGI
jgi:hypothetical protein